MNVILVGLLALTAAYATWQLRHVVRVWRRLSGARLVTCTATGRPAAVRLDVRHAAFSAFVASSPEARIADCSLWATCGLCDRGCMRQALKDESALRNVVGHWYADRRCVHCGTLIGTAQSFGHHAALRTPQGVTREWTAVPADRMVDSLKTDWPVCWNCHVAATLRREYPGVVTDRPWPKVPDRRAG